MPADDRQKPHVIRLETERYIVRTLDPGDATESWGEWLNDPGTAHALNIDPQRMTPEQTRAYIERFDRAQSHIIGVFEKETSLLIGIRTIYIDWKAEAFLINTLIGERAARNKGARTETMAVVFNYFFEDLDLKTAHYTVLADNEAILRPLLRSGRSVHIKTEKRPAVGGGTVDIHHFQMPRERWRASQQPKA
jgi:RimJ/RimL family protein N-acetyltransferase